MGPRGIYATYWKSSFLSKFSLLMASWSNRSGLCAFLQSRVSYYGPAWDLINALFLPFWLLPSPIDILSQRHQTVINAKFVRSIIQQLLLCLIQCSNVPMFQCPNVPMFKCSNVQMFNCSNIQMFKCSNVPMFKCSNVQMYKCSNVKNFKYSNVKW